MIRKFTLKNAVNEEIQLNSLNNFAYEPQGLGVAFSNDYVRTDTEFILSRTNPEMGEMSVNMLFGAVDGESYKDFRNFAKFLNQQPLTLIYETDAGKYQRICRLKEMTKSEIDKWNVIDETMTLSFLTPWFTLYKPDNLNPDQFGDGKIYAAASDTPPIDIDLLPDSVITNLSSGNWIANGNAAIWSVDSENQYLSGFNVVMIDQEKANLLSIPQSQRFLSALNINLNNQAVGNTVLLHFFFKADYIDSNFETLIVSAFDGDGNLVNAVRLADSFGQIYSDGKVYYNLPFNQSGKWNELKIAYLIQSSGTKISKITFNFNDKNSQFNYITKPKLAVMDESENPDCYYLYDYVYEEEKDDPNTNYFEVFNDSEYFGTNNGAPVKITIEAGDEEVLNPSWNVMVGSQVVQSDRFFFIIQPGGKLIVSSYPEDKYARLYYSDGSFINAYQYQDINKTNFVKLPQGASTVIFDIGEAKVNFEARFEKLLV